MESWCGHIDQETCWVISGVSISCLFYSIGIVAFLAIGTWSIISSVRYIRLLDRLGSSQSYLWNINEYERHTWLKISQVAQLAIVFSLIILHVVIVGVLWGTRGRAPYMTTTETIAVALWTATAFLLWKMINREACLRCCLFASASAFIYTLSLCLEVTIYIEGFGVSPAQRRARLMAAVVADILVLAFLYLEISKPKQDLASMDSLRQHLLENAAYDEEIAENSRLSGEGNNQRKRKRTKPWYSLVGYAAKYMWPDEFLLRIRALTCIALICLMRALNLLVPLLWKKVIDVFSLALSTKTTEKLDFSSLFTPWVALWLGLWLLQGGSGGGSIGLLSNLRSYLWIPISQNAYRRASIDIFSHVMDMDHGWHLHRRTGELLRIMDRGTASMQTLLGTVAFQIGPAIFDIVAAAVFLAFRLNWWIAVIVFITLSTYLPLTIWLTEWRGQFRRDLNAKDNARSARATDALLNYETVKLFHNENLESSQYSDSIREYQKVDFKLSASMAALNVLQSLIIWIGLAAGMIVVTVGIAKRTLTVGDAVLFVGLMQQLYGPLNWFGTYYRMIQTAMLDMEGVFDLLTTQPTIQDPPNPICLLDRATKYEVQFDNVSFSYSAENPSHVLRNVSFVAKGGGTTALVGETGSGKSSLLRLILRFYDPTVGKVCIDGIDLRNLSLDSLRRSVGVVPQDCVLFNDTLKYNIRYGRPGASDEEVFAAAEGACIADTIQSRFPQGYDTLVGERGLRLSGGEKQRVAFARALLKNPNILILDEASSALDSVTESRIQETLASARSDRTVLVVAHRLSTIVNADQIIVMSKGEVVETGTHEELLQIEKGHYSSMWIRQVDAVGPGSRVPSSQALATSPDQDDVE